MHTEKRCGAIAIDNAHELEVTISKADVTNLGHFSGAVKDDPLELRFPRPVRPRCRQKREALLYPIASLLVELHAAFQISARHPALFCKASGRQKIEDPIRFNVNDANPALPYEALDKEVR